MPKSLSIFTYINGKLKKNSSGKIKNKINKTDLEKEMRGELGFCRISATRIILKRVLTWPQFKKYLPRLIVQPCNNKRLFGIIL